ncbi:MAG: dihydroorotate dehydrogenase-like protein [Candidatus Eremiobacteraeota bacterium]|nr:dihydroorotate dehydrogenase-like protein [Candidatus Eremiobacteraeota bacterium]
MTDLATEYMGLRLRNPVVASASPLCGDVAKIVALAEYGAAAVVLPSLFEEQIEAETHALQRHMSVGSNSFAEALSYFPKPESYMLGTARYLDLIRRARAAVDIPVIASLNGITGHGWVEYARQIEDAGASGLELNIYFIPADLTLGALDVEARYADIVAGVTYAVKIPVAVKLAPYFSAFGTMAQRLAKSGARALVLFNRFYQPDIDVAQLSLRHDLELSNPNDIRLPLLWIALLHGNVPLSLAASSGVQTSEEVIKYVLAGADVVMTTSALLRNGVEHIASLVDGLQFWLDANGFRSVEAARGMFSHARVADPTAFERANYVHVLHSYAAREPRAAVS